MYVYSYSYYHAYNLTLPQNVETPSEENADTTTHEKETKKLTSEVSSIHNLLVKSVPSDLDDNSTYFDTLLEKLERKSMAALEFVADDVGAEPIRTEVVSEQAVHIRWHKIDVARGLVKWVGHNHLYVSRF